MGLIRWLAIKLLGVMGQLPHQRVRRYRVTHFGEPVGTFTLPIGEHMEDPNANERPILTKPIKVDFADYYYFYWVERYPNGGYKTVTWHPPTSKLREEAARFYNVSHGLRSDGTPDPSKQQPLATRTVEETRLLRAIIANRDAKQPYLDYAEWLISKRDSYGDYIKLTLEIESIPEGDSRRERLTERREKLVEKHGAKWVRPLTEIGLFPGFHFNDLDGFMPGEWFSPKGVIEALRVPGDTNVFPNNLARLFYGAPCLRNLQVNDLRITVADFAALPQMAAIETLSLSIGHGVEDDYRRFAMSPHLSGLRSLSLFGHHCGPGGATHLANAAWLDGVHTLALGLNNLGDDGVAAIGESSFTSNLTYLDIQNNEITDHGLEALCSSRGLGKLAALHLASNRFTVEGMRALVAAPFAGNLATLTLGGSNLNTEAVIALVAVNFAALTTLDISFNEAGEAGWNALLRAPFFRNLEVLYVNGISIDDSAIETLTALGFLPLRELEIGLNQITAAGFSALIRSKTVTKLVKLRLNECPIGPMGIQALAETDLPALEELDLRSVPCGPAGAKALAASPYFKKLKQLWISEEHTGLAGREALLERFTNSVVTFL